MPLTQRVMVGAIAFYQANFNIMTSIAITGATGFVGRQVLKYLSQGDHNIKILTRKPQIADQYQANIKVIEVENLFHEKIELLTEILKDVEILIHLAWYAEPGKYLTSSLNIDCLTGTLNLAQAFSLAGGKRFIGIGTCFEYDLDQCLLSVDTPLKPKTIYAASKASAFQLLTQILSISKVEFVWCRLFYLYGEGEDYRRFVPYLKQQLSNGEIAELTSGEQIRDFLNVQDAGRMIAEEALGSHQGATNICSGIPVTVRQLAEKIADHFNRRDLLKFGSRPDNLIDPPCVVGVRGRITR
jgi:nucleoside-diphosphate-sugar epimerase